MLLGYLVLFQITIYLSGFIIGRMQTIPVGLSLMLSLSFLFTAFYYWWKNKRTYSTYVFSALVFGFVGDLVLMKLVPGGLMLGMLFFGFEHILLILCFVRMIRREKGKVLKGKVPVFAGAYCAFALAIWGFTSLQSGKDSLLIGGSLIYGLLIAVMATFAFSLYVNNNEYLRTAIGAGAFVLSDSIISISQFQDFTLSELLIKTTYYIAMFGIIHANNKLDFKKFLVKI